MNKDCLGCDILFLSNKGCKIYNYNMKIYESMLNKELNIEEIGEQFLKVIEGEIDFYYYPWPFVSQDAKDLISSMLSVDPA